MKFPKACSKLDVLWDLREERKSMETKVLLGDLEEHQGLV